MFTVYIIYSANSDRFYVGYTSDLVKRIHEHNSGMNTSTANSVSYTHLDVYKRQVLVLRAVNHKLRQRIIEVLDESDNMTVTDIYIKLRLEQSVASQHLAILRRAGVVVTDRQGKFIYYSLDKERLNQISKLIEGLVG